MVCKNSVIDSHYIHLLLSRKISW